MVMIKEKAKIEIQENIEFQGKIKKDEDISAVVSFGSFLAIGSDESKRKIQILQMQGDNVYQVKDDLEIKLPVLAEEDDQEIDIEGMSISNGNTLFVIGSHSLRRLRVREDKTYLENRERITRVISEDKKNTIFKLTLNPQTAAASKEIETIRIKEIIENDSILGIFTPIPSKENGIDIEGIASDGDTLYIGFRGPVLRGNYVPVMVIEDFEKKSDYELRFLNLGGNGIRDITKVKGGFLIIAGPVGDGIGSYQLHFWDGLDCLPGKDKPQNPHTTLLGEIPPPKNAEGKDFKEAKAEGIAVIEEHTKGNSTVYQVIVVYDSVPQGGAITFEITNPKQPQ